MAEQQITYALTNKARVKARMGMQEANLDTLIDRLIAESTDFIEGESGGRRFLRTTYTNEVYSVYNATAMQALKNIPIISVSSVQYRYGLKSNPNWTEFNTDDWEISEDGGSGIIRIAGMPTGVNSIRFSYIAGFLIDFDSAGSPASHTLPADLSGLCERLVIKKLNRRNKEGLSTESFEGGTVTYKELLDDEDKAVIAKYRRVPRFV